MIVVGILRIFKCSFEKFLWSWCYLVIFIRCKNFFLVIFFYNKKKEMIISGIGFDVWVLVLFSIVLGNFKLILLGWI